MRRLVLGTTAAVAVVTAGLASAAALGGISSDHVSAGNAAIAACDGNGFSVSYTTVGGNVTAATVADIADPDCEGGNVSITITDSAGDGIASGGPSSIPTDGDTSPNSLTVSVSPQPAAEQVAGVHVAVVGP
ncbi:MAG: hypothetical protein ACRDOS_13125 [Gaiellaceae bacterium]